MPEKGALKNNTEDKKEALRWSCCSVDSMDAAEMEASGWTALLTCIMSSFEWWRAGNLISNWQACWLAAF